MKLTYAEYRDSDVEWLGDVPVHWDVPSCRHVCRLEYGDSLPLEQREAGDVPVYGSNGVVGEHCDANTLAPAIIVGRKGSHGKVNFAAERAFAIDTTYFVDSRSTASNLRWLYYVLSSAGLDETSKDSAVPGLSRDDAYAMHLPLPPMDEQRSIGAYLDCETARIDKLITMQESLIERLDEYRTALITRVVTKGLPPEAAEDAGLGPREPKFRDSGVEWLGEVPEHWDVDHLRRCVKWIKTGSTPTSAELHESVGDDIAWFSPGDVGSALQMKRPSRALARRAVVEGVVPLFPADSTVIVGIGATTGRVGHIEEPSTGNQQLTCIVGNDRVFPRFVSWQLWAYTNVMRSIAPRSTLPILNNEFLLSLPLAVPSLIEQEAIAEHLDAASHRCLARKG